MKIMDELSEICRQHTLQLPFDTVVPEPYVPFVPDSWNHVLVLAEAQNLSKRSQDVDWLMSATSVERIFRLGRNGRVAIQPWDDGSLKLAAEAALGINAAETAVSNAVPWSLVDEDGKNINPTPELIKRSMNIWSEFLLALKPKSIVTAGVIARRVVAGALDICGDKPVCTAWPLPSPRLFSPISKTLEEAELRQRFPEVERAICQHPEWIRERRPNKVLFACLAVAAVKGHDPKEKKP